MTKQERLDKRILEREQQKQRRQLLKAAAVLLYPYPTNGNTNDPEDYAFRCKKVDHERRLYIIRNL